MSNLISGSPQSPQEVSPRLSHYLGEGDIDGAMSLYEANSTFAPRPGEVISGLAAIREALIDFAALDPTMTLATPKIMEADGVALVNGGWNLRGRQPDGAAVEMGGFGTDVVRRQPDGSWKFLIDNPWGIDT